MPLTIKTSIGCVKTENGYQDISGFGADLDLITEKKYSKNRYYETTITEGKYLNPNTGSLGTNADYWVGDNYIPIKPNTQYVFDVWTQAYNNRGVRELGGSFSGFVCWYDSNKAFISGFSSGASSYPVTSPANAMYMRCSTKLTNRETYYYYLCEQSEQTTDYVPHRDDKTVIKPSSLPKPYTVVDKTGNGDYTSIQDAIDNADEDGYILVMPSVYEETVSTWYVVNGSTFGKRIHLIGLDRDNTIIKNTSTNYSTPPLEFSNGSMRNITVVAQGGDTQTEGTSCYAMHMETNSLYGKDAVFENCVFKSNVNYPIGIGLRGGGASVVFRGCDFIGNGASAGCIWFHDADASVYRGTCNVVFDGCNMICDGNNYPIRINAMHNNNLTNITFKRNTVWAKTNQTANIYNTWNTGGVSGDGWRGLQSMYLTYDSFGNSESAMNYR